jgi:hypothetical protein
MVNVYRSASLVAPDGVASCFLALDEGIVTRLAHRLDIAEVEEQRLVALVCPLVIGHCGAGMMPVAFYDNAAAALAGVEIAEERLLADAMRAAPARIAIEAAESGGFG